MVLIDSKIIEYYNNAFSLAHSDPSAAVNNARKAAERICKNIINNAGKNLPQNTSIGSLLEYISNRHINIDSKLILSIRTIQQYANYGAHDQSFQSAKGINNRGDLIPEDILPCINALKRMLNICNSNTNISKSDHNKDNTDFFQLDLPKDYTIKIATSNLTVTDSIIQSCECEQLFSIYNIPTQFVHRKWNDQIITDLSNNILDIAIYNKESALQYLSSNPDKKVHIIRDVCSSMGGRNFYILALKGSKWECMTLSQFKEALDSNTIIAVSRNSDMEKNLCYVLDKTLEDLKNKNIILLDYHTNMGLDYFDINPDILIIGGQDLRFLAEYNKKYIEVLSYDTLPTEKKEYFYNNSINSLIVSPIFFKMCSKDVLEKIADQLILNFYKNNLYTKSKNKILKKLRPQIRQITEDDDAANYIMKRILFETYRFF